MRFALMCSLSSLIYWFEPFISFSVWLILVIPWGIGGGWGGASKDSHSPLIFQALPQSSAPVLALHPFHHFTSYQSVMCTHWWSLGGWACWFRFDTKSGLTSHKNSHYMFPPLGAPSSPPWSHTMHVIIGTCHHLNIRWNQWGPAAVARQ